MRRTLIPLLFPQSFPLLSPGPFPSFVRLCLPPSPIGTVSSVCRSPVIDLLWLPRAVQLSSAIPPRNVITLPDLEIFTHTLEHTHAREHANRDAIRASEKFWKKIRNLLSDFVISNQVIWIIVKQITSFQCSFANLPCDSSDGLKTTVIGPEYCLTFNPGKHVIPQ